jgi:hypothetical protein
MEDKNLSLADTFNLKNHNERNDPDFLQNQVAEVRADLIALREKLDSILQKLD